MAQIPQQTLFDLTQDGLVIGEKIQRIYPEFDVSTFVMDVRKEMEGQTIYNVTKAIGRVLRHHLPQNYSEALAILMNYVDAEAIPIPTSYPTAETETCLRPISHFIRLYGLANFDASLDAFALLSKYRCTRGGEIREFIIKDANRCFQRFSEWVKDENANLRLFVAAALCTRGTWQKWLRPFIQDPQPILALLETLKDDPDARVREHVAKDMRDIVKDYPEIGYTTLEQWSQDGSAETEKILRQALKYQVKIGDKRAYKLLGLGMPQELGKAEIALIELQSESQSQPINVPFRFSFSFQSGSDEPQTILTYYIIAYKRPTGHITRKRYRFSQRKLKPKQRVAYEKSLFPLPSLKQFDDGKACLGWHRFELEVNGDVIGGFDFEVTAPKDHKHS
ncbi:MAG: hypothetical protein OXM61_10380 [Candidatus Poribacteria bacterium]|nr:hypothetical protein [Candidatus Poribacteria bacterium]